VLEASRQILAFSGEVKLKAQSLDEVMVQLKEMTQKFQV